VVHLYKSLVLPHVEYCRAACSLQYLKDKVLIEIYRDDLQELRDGKTYRMKTDSEN